MAGFLLFKLMSIFKVSTMNHEHILLCDFFNNTNFKIFKHFQRLGEMTPLRGSGRPGESEAPRAAWPQPLSGLLRGWTKPLALQAQGPALPSPENQALEGTSLCGPPLCGSLSPEPTRGCPQGPSKWGGWAGRQRQAGRGGYTGGRGPLEEQER